MIDNLLKGKILWADDEIDLLESHIIYLEKRGYSVEPVNSGEDALHRIKESDFDLVLLDEMMDGLDGLTTLKMIKDVKPNIPVVMVTKNEEEWLMEEAIGEQISYFLTKPVNPSQILLACKNILETSQIQNDKTSSKYLQEFQKISTDFESADNIEDWFQIHGKLTDWTFKFDQFGDPGLKPILTDQYEEANQKFNNYVSANYRHWVNAKERPLLSPDIIKNYVKPALDNDEKVVFIVVDCLRFDQWSVICELLYPYYNIKTDRYLSILPTATPYARNAIFSGLFPDSLQSNYTHLWKKMVLDETSMNRFEDIFLKDQLKRFGFQKKTVNYFKILSYEDGNKLGSRINEYKTNDVLAIVINFIDMLGHGRSESELLKELIPDETAYRNAVRSWMENAWFLNVMQEVSNWGHKVIISSDHGTIRVNKPVRVKADKMASSGVRYKFGRNLHSDRRSTLSIENPKQYRLPKDDLTTNYLIAKGRNFFVYPNDYHRFVNKFQNSFQHGGISMDEMIVPVATLTGKR